MTSKSNYRQRKASNTSRNTEKLLQQTKGKVMTKKSSSEGYHALDPKLQDLLQMLAYKRPAGSNTEKQFIERWLHPLGAKPDLSGNYWVTIGDSPIMWSSHTDTVHTMEGRQAITYGDGHVFLSPNESSNCLGADCTVGVWLMREMITAKVPGTYIFHHSEEIGGLGSNYIASKTPERLVGINYAIAFDRKGFTEIITHQMQGRCASDEFGLSLSQALSPMGMVLSRGGTFTDTANYDHIIPECTNIAVGYFNQHTPNEYLSVTHANNLLTAILQADFSNLVCSRTPSITPDFEYEGDIWGYGSNRGFYGYGKQKSFFDFSGGRRNEHVFAPLSLVDYVRSRPDLVAEYLYSCDITKEDLEDYDREQLPPPPDENETPPF